MIFTPLGEYEFCHLDLFRCSLKDLLRGLVDPFQKDIRTDEGPIVLILNLIISLEVTVDIQTTLP